MKKTTKHSQHSIVFHERPLVVAVRHALPYIVGLSLAFSTVQHASSRSSESAAAFTATQLVRQFTLKNTVSQVSLGMQGYVVDVNGQQRGPAMGEAPSGWPADMGSVPTTVNLPRRDGAGRPLGYCAWDNSSTTPMTGYIVNDPTRPDLVYAVVSPGLNGTMQTSCAYILANGVGVGDDHVQVTAPIQISSVQYKSSVATFADLPAGEEGDVRLVRDTNKLYSYVGGTWGPIDGSKFSDDSATNGVGAIAYTTGKVTVADFQATTATFSGGVTANTFTGNGGGLTDLNAANFSSGVMAPQFGGTGVNASAAANGTLLIGNGSGFTLGTLTAGAGISVLNDAGAITISNSGVISITGTADQIITSANNGNVVLSLPQNIATNSIPTFGGMMLNGDLMGTNATFNGTVTMGSLAAQRLDVGTSAGGVTDPNLIVGIDAMTGAQSGFGGNTALGYSALSSSSSSSNNTAVGFRALRLTTTGSQNVAVGLGALRSNTTGNWNTAVGKNALEFAVVAIENVGVGLDALRLATGSGNTAVGSRTLDSVTSGTYNTALGQNSDVTLGTLSYATLIGAESRVSTSNTVVIGALGANKSGSITDDQVVIGATSRNDTFAGTKLYVNGVTNLNGDLRGTTATFTGAVSANSFAGDGSGLTNLDISNFTGILPAAQGGTGLDGSAAANGSLLIGNGTGYTLNTLTGTVNQVNVTNGAGTITLSLPQNIATTSTPTFGGLTLSGALNGTTGTFTGALTVDSLAAQRLNVGTSLGVSSPNLIIGNDAMPGAQTGNGNNAVVGISALNQNTSGQRNTAVGNQALYANTTGSNNTANGFAALFSNTTGLTNVAIGNVALYGNTTGNNNVAIGSGAGYSTLGGVTTNANTTGGANTFLGSNAMPGTATPLFNATALGAEATVSTSNTLALGRNSATDQIVIGTDTRNDTFAGTKLYVNGVTNLNGDLRGTTATFTGAITANSFVGDGSGLTNLDVSDFSTGILPVARGGTGLDGSAAANGSLLIGNGTGYTLGTLTGTADQVNVTNGAGTITLSLPQSIATTSSPTFGGATLNGALTGTSASFSSNATVGGTLAVTGATTLTGALAANGGITSTTGTFTGNVALNTGSIANNTSLRDLRVYSSENGPSTWDHLQVRVGNSTTAINVGGADSGLVFGVGNGTSGDVGGQTYNTVLTLRADQSATFTGAVSANSFAGNGSALTNLNASNFTTGTVPVARGGTGLDGSAAANGSLLIGNGTGYTLNALTGTANQINVTNGAGTITLSLPQSIATTSSPTFGGMTLNGALTGTTGTFTGAVTVDSLSAQRLNVSTATGVTGANLIIGSSAMSGVQTGDGLNTAVGINALAANTSGNRNTAVGRDTLSANTTGNNNTVVGYNLLNANTTGNRNSGLGTDALRLNTTGSDLTALGAYALEFSSTASGNTAIGSSALRANTTGADNTANGAFALTNNTTGLNNVALGRSAGNTNTTGNDNTFLGYNANATTGALTFATAIGSGSTVATSNTMALGRNNVTDQIVIGTDTRNDTFAGTKLYVNGVTNLNGDLRGTTANFTGRVDAASLFVNGVEVTGGGSVTRAAIQTALEGNFNIALGTGSLQNGSFTGANNTVFGVGAAALTTGASQQNVVIGRLAGQLLGRFTAADGNTLVGYQAGYQIQAASGGDYNTLIGHNSDGGSDITYGTALGAATSVTGASYSTAIGSGSSVATSNTIALGRNSTVDQVVIGTNTRNDTFANTKLYVNGPTFLNGDLRGTTATFTGAVTVDSLSALRLNVGTSAGPVTNPNLIIGNGAMPGAQSGSGGNTAVGINALAANTSASRNTAIGINALMSTTTGGTNVAVGDGALMLNTAGANTAIGSLAMSTTTSGDSNTAIGGGALGANTTGTGNIAIGRNALSGNVSGDHNLGLGRESRMDSGNLEYASAIGAYSKVSTSNTVVLGALGANKFLPGTNDQVVIGGTARTGTYDLYVDGTLAHRGITALSDRRIKSDIQQISADEVLSRFENLNVYNYYYSDRRNLGRQIGVIAQEVLGLYPDLVNTDDPNLYSVHYDKIGVMAAAGVGRLNVRFKELDTKVNEQGTKILSLEELTGKHDKRIGALESWKTEAVGRMDTMQTAIDLNIQKIADHAVAIQTNAKAIERLDDALITLDDKVKGNTNAIDLINQRWARNFSESADGSLLTVTATELKVSNFTAQQMRANSVYTQRLEAEMARIADLEVNNLRANTAVANTVQAEQVNTGSVQVYAGVGMPAVLFAAKADGHYTVSTSSLDGSYATATVIVNAGQAKVVSGASEGIELVAEGNMVKAIAAGKSIKASWIKMG